MFRTDSGPHGIDLAAPGGVEALLAFHRGIYGYARMEEPKDPPADQDSQQGDPLDNTSSQERPNGVTEDEWQALGDPGKRAIVREREARTRAEHDLAASRAASKLRPKGDPPPKGKDTAGDGANGGEPAADDIAALVQQAVTEAMAPFQQAQQQREAEHAAREVAQAVTTAAKDRLHDASDALTQVDISTLTDGSGQPDQIKITAALEDLVRRKPHLARVVDDRRRPGAGSFMGGAPAGGVSMDDQVKAALARMQESTGIRLPSGG